jgi:hypothetical protein
MIAITAALLVALTIVAVLHARGSKTRHAGGLGQVVAAAAVLVAAAASVV